MALTASIMETCHHQHQRNRFLQGAIHIRIILEKSTHHLFSKAKSNNSKVACLLADELGLRRCQAWLGGRAHYLP